LAEWKAAHPKTVSEPHRVFYDFRLDVQKNDTSAQSPSVRGFFRIVGTRDAQDFFQFAEGSPETLRVIRTPFSAGEKRKQPGRVVGTTSIFL